MSSSSSDQPRIPRLTNANYNVWAEFVKVTLTYKGLWYLVKEGTKPILAMTSEDVQKREQDDAYGRAILMAAVGEDNLGHIMKLKTLKEQWNKLQKVHVSTGKVRLTDLMKQFFTYQSKTNENVHQLASKLTSLQTEIAAIDADERPTDTMKRCVLFEALGDSYKVTTEILRRTDETDFDKIVRALRETEESIETKNKPQTESALATKGDRGRPGNDRSRSSQKFLGKCNHCKKPGHKKLDCRVWLATDEGKKHLEEVKRTHRSEQAKEATVTTWGESDSEGAHLAAEDTAVTPAEGAYEATEEADTPAEGAYMATETAITNSTAWIIDSGASSHMTADRKLFVNSRNIEKRRIFTAGSTVLTSTEIGEVRIPLRKGGTLPIEDVLYVPGLSNSLLSIPQLARKGVDSFFGHTTVVFRKGEKAIAGGFLRGGTYKLDTLYSGYAALIATALVADVVESSTPYDLWHRRYGHLGPGKIENLHKVVIGVGRLKAPGSHTLCEPCQFAKKIRVVNRAKPEETTRLLERVYSDFWGPYKVPSLGGHRYMLTFTDDYSRKVWVVFTKQRTELYNEFAKWKARVEKETEQKILNVRSDNAGEYITLGHLMEADGIRLERTVAYTPEENGVAERMNRTIITVAKAMLFESKLGQEFWAEAASTAEYVRNRAPVSRGGRTPEEVYTGKTPNVKHMRVFGCICYGHIPKERRAKLDEVSFKGIFVGYQPTTKQFRVFDPKRNEVVPVISVDFFENERGAAIAPPSSGSVPFETDDDYVDSIDLDGNDVAMEEAPPLRTNPVGAGLQNRVGAPPQPAVMPPVEVAPQGQRMAEMIAPREPRLPPEARAEEGEVRAPSPIMEEDVRPDSPTPIERHPVGAEVPNLDVSTVRRSTRTAVKPARFRDEVAVAIEEDSGVDTMDENDFGTSENSDQSERRICGERALAATSAGGLDALGHSKIVEPTTYKEAVSHPQHGKQWKEAIERELASLLSYNTWKLEPLPANRDTVDSKWVFKIKYDVDGRSIRQFKARLVARGFTQRYGIDYDETFAPTLRYTSLRALLSIAASEDFEIEQMDVTSAYLCGNLKEDIYMKPPEGFDAKGLTCKLIKSLYGLKQSARVWNHTIAKTFHEMGFRPINADNSVFYHATTNVIIALYVDDMLLIGRWMEHIRRYKEILKKAYKIKDLGAVTQVLGFNVRRNRKARTLTIDQAHQIDAIGKDYGLQDSRNVRTPIEGYEHLRKAGDEARTNVTRYQQVIGSLMYVMQGSRPDIAFALGKLSQQCQDPAVFHWKAVMKVVAYLRSTVNYCIMYGPRKNLIGYSDSDYASDKQDRVSTLGFIYMLNGGAIAWASKKQRCVATSTVESEYIALCKTIKEGVWIRRFLLDLDFGFFLGPLNAVDVQGDNTGANTLVKDPKQHDKSKHIDIHYHYSRNMVARSIVTVSYCPTSNMVADGLTKPLPVQKFEHSVAAMGLKA